MTIPDGLRRNELGYYEVTDKPTAAELRAYYAQRYYQENHATYQAAYPPAELEHIRGKLRLRAHVAQALADATAPGRFLDVGCGEGWALAYFQEQGYDVLGLDFSSFGLDQLNPALRERLRTGDLYEQLVALRAEKAAFELLWLDNVLEHVPDPAALLAGCRALAAPGAVLMVEVPNDFSALQEHLLTAGHIDRPFWVALPDHLSYFNQAGLTALALATGWRVADVLADHPIDLDLLNPATNYVRDRAAGPASHRKRVELDNLVQHAAPLPAVAAYYRGLAGVGLGRNIVAFLRPDGAETAAP
ncbi:class I SAM-dependent methyltransferase [uncultured Hymenobacter sp.]|uniref:class I SAM-dependent methyltransferase n=1 Tax=uncultured Hymenobacter sp. TaxID=170016 RepID=UPI0035CC143C